MPRHCLLFFIRLFLMMTTMMVISATVSKHLPRAIYARDKDTASILKTFLSKALNVRCCRSARDILLSRHIYNALKSILPNINK